MSIGAWMIEVVSTYGYLGAFLISIIGNFTIFFSIPYVLAIYAFGATLNPLLLGLVAGAGASVGEFSAYLLGYGGRLVVEERYGRQLNAARKLIQRHGMAAIFIFAVTPLPTDLIIVPLGMLRYSLRKAMIAMFAGKTIMCTAVAYAGRYSYWYVLAFFESGGGALGIIVLVVLLALIVYTLLKVDWTKYIE